MMRVICLGLLSVALAGCGSIGKGTFANELAVVPGTGQLRFISFYGPVGIAAKIDSPAAAASASATTIGVQK